ncbi:MAG: M23 family metallopeptidase [Comamonadaceae bacterium]|nr:M23 family metallopeptidase [Comamonadaceae bacterium]
MLWKDAFVQLSNSQVEANFADQRTYTYNGEAIDIAYHLGYDLSVTKNYPVEAANSGTVAFTGDLGIYGNTVILDHGLGLFTLYSHLNSIDVQAGRRGRQAPDPRQDRRDRARRRRPPALRRLSRRRRGAAGGVVGPEVGSTTLAQAAPFGAGRVAARTR